MRKLTYEIKADGRKIDKMVGIPKEPLTKREIERRNKRIEILKNRNK